MRIAITIGNVNLYNVDSYIEATRDNSTDGSFGPESFGIDFGTGVWKGEREETATFTLWANARTCYSFENALTRHAIAEGEECVLVVEDGLPAYTSKAGIAKARLRYEHKNVSVG